MLTEGCRSTRLKLRLISIKFSVFVSRNRNWRPERRYETLVSGADGIG
jgi:hypothetical protein